MQVNFDEINYKYKLPKNFDENNKEFNLYKNYQEFCKKPRIILTKNCRIASNSVVFKKFKIFQQTCISQENYEKYQKGYKFFLKYILPQFNFSKKRFLLITDEWSDNYYHWHLFALQRLAVLKEAGLIENSILLLPEKYKKIPYALPSLKKFGIDENQIVYLRKKSNIKVKELAFVDIGQNHPQLAKKIREILLENSKNHDLNLGERIYVSRNKQKLRYVENEDEMMKILEKYGFKKIYTEDLPYEDQIAIFRNAKYLVSPHGAGLTNVLFMKDGASVFEITSSIVILQIPSVFYRMASMLNMTFYHHGTKTANTIEKSIDCHYAIYKIDLDHFEKNLKLMLENE